MNYFDNLEPFDCVILIKKYRNLEKGTHGTIIEKYNNDNFLVEFFDGNGDTIDVYDVTADYLKVYGKNQTHKEIVTK